MATLAAIESELGGIPSDQRRSLLNAFKEIVKNGIRFGRPGDAEPTENFSGHFYAAETSSVSGREFIVPHSLGRAPYLAIPILDLQTVGSQSVALEVTRAADATNVYLSSASTSIPFGLYVEG
jgi:hypothetical protein